MRNRGLFANMLFVVAFIYLFMAIIKIFLPITSVEIQKDINYNFAFNYSLQNIYNDDTNKTKQPVKKSINFELIGIYSDGKKSVVTISKNKQTSILSIGEEYDGFELIKTTNILAIFTNNNNEYELSIEDTKDKKINSSFKIEKIDPLSTYDVEYSDIQQYKDNPKKLWSEITINKKQVGYMVDKIKKDSKIASLGLKKGDIIKMVNGQDIQSDGDAVKLYKSINELEFMTITVLRDGEYVDLEFNIIGQKDETINTTTEEEQSNNTKEQTNQTNKTNKPIKQKKEQAEQNQLEEQTEEQNQTKLKKTEQNQTDKDSK